MDYSLVTQHFSNDFKEHGGEVFLDWEFVSIERSDDKDYPIRLVPKNFPIANVSGN